MSRVWSLVIGIAVWAAACSSDPPSPTGGTPGEPQAGSGGGRMPPGGTMDPAPSNPTPAPMPGMSTPTPTPTPGPSPTPTPTPPGMVDPNTPPGGIPTPTPTPTPPGAGDAGVAAPAPVPPPAPPPTAISFDPPGGNFIGTQAVKLVVGAADAVVRYTTDGSLPGATSTVYSGPIMLAQTAIVRAVAESPSAGKGPVAVAVYVRAGPELANFESNLPIVLLHTHRSGTLGVASGTPLVSGSVSVFEPPTGGKVKLVGPATFTKRAGLRIRGNSSRTFSQKSYAFELRQEATDEDDDRQVVGLPAESDWNLIAPSRPDRSLVRNAVAFTLSNEIQRYAPRVRMVEVFTVESGAAGTVSQSTYKGVFTLTEKIKVNKNRIRIEPVNLMARTEPDITGGYVFKIDHPQGTAHWRVDGICHCVFDMINNMPFQMVDPDWDDLSAAQRTAFGGYLRGYLQEFFNAVRAPDFKNPANGKHYSEYIDVGGFIDHNLLNAIFKNVDSLRLSAYFYKEKGGKVVAGPLWDMDLSSGTPYDDQFGSRTGEAREWARVDGTDPLRYAFWGRLYNDPVYQAAYKKRWAELLAGPFSVTHIHETIDKFAAELREASARHFAKWTEYRPNGGSHANEIRILKDWFAARIPWMAGELD